MMLHSYVLAYLVGEMGAISVAVSSVIANTEFESNPQIMNALPLLVIWAPHFSEPFSMWALLLCSPLLRSLLSLLRPRHPLRPILPQIPSSFGQLSSDGVVGRSRAFAPEPSVRAIERLYQKWSLLLNIPPSDDYR